MRNIRENMKDEGITLIALVVTIIVLLILAGITISMALGNNGIIQRTRDAKQITDDAQIKERIQLAYQSALAGGQGTYTKDTLMNELKKEFENDYDVDDSDDKIWKMKAQGQEIEVLPGMRNTSTTDLEKLRLYFSKGPSEFFENDEYKNTEPIMDAKNTIHTVEMGLGASVIEYNDKQYTVWFGEWSVNETVFQIRTDFSPTILITPSTPGHLIHVVNSTMMWNGYNSYQCLSSYENDDFDRYYNVSTGELTGDSWGG